MTLENETLMSLREYLKQTSIIFEDSSHGFATTDFIAHSALLTIFPKDSRELNQVIVKLNEIKQPFHIVSAGHNWGYGDSNLSDQISILVNLRLFNRILGYNSELGTVEIEPGVTQEQLAQFLLKNNSQWSLDVTGADGLASIMGNFLERGFGHTAGGDHERASKVVEVMTVEGRVFCPQLVSSGSSHVKGLYQHDVSLNLDRIFYQTNFAIVTRMVVQLKPKQSQTSFCIVFLESDQDVANAVAVISRLKAQDVIAAIPHIGNSGRLQKTTSGSVDARMNWAAAIDISGPSSLVRARKKILSQHFSCYQKMFLSTTRVNWIGRLINWLPTKSLYKNQFENLRLLNQLLSGTPTDDFVINSIGKDSKAPKKMNWIGPLFPCQPEHFLKVKNIVSQIFTEYGLVFSATVSLVNSRCAVMITEITDSQNIGISEQDLQGCYRQCHERLWEAGYPIYRYGLRSGVVLENQLKQNPEYLKVYQSLKKHFDPNDLLSRGRWGIRILPE